MKLQIIQRNALDNDKWNSLVKRTKDASIFSYSWYLDALAENWCVLVDDAYQFGIALPYTIRLKQRILYTPIFVSYLELLGEQNRANFEDVAAQIFATFNIVEIEFKQAILGSNHDVFVCQSSQASTKYGSQARRMLGKAVKHKLDVIETQDWRAIHQVIQAQLNHKFTGMTDASMSRLEKTYAAAQEMGVLRAFEIRNQNECLGGVICFENDHQLFYSKGAALDEARNNGGMYAAINSAMLTAFENGKIFDFGGSRVEGVRRFNLNLGGVDQNYFSYRFDNSPFWFKLLRKIKKSMSKHH